VKVKEGEETALVDGGDGEPEPREKKAPMTQGEND